MNMEFENLSDYLTKRKTVAVGDYIYIHVKSGYPLKINYDTAGLYFVKNVSNNIIMVIGVSSGPLQKIDINNIDNKYWILPVPFRIKESLK